MKELCNSCENRGKTNGLSEESYCSSCVHSDSWKVDHFKPSNKKTLISVIGPDGVGKDTAAKLLKSILKEKYNKESLHLYNAKSLKTFTCRYLNIPESDYEYFKRKDCKILNKSLREWMVYFGEYCFKPAFGNDVFVNEVIKEIENSLDIHFFIKSDDRFAIEFSSNDKLKEFNIIYLNLQRTDLFFPYTNTSYISDYPSYYSETNNFIKNTDHKVINMEVNDNLEDLELKLENLLQKEF